MSRPRYRVEIAPAVRKQLKPIPSADKSRILNKIDSLERDPRPAGCKQLEGFRGFYRIRAGDYRIIYTIDDEVLIVAVLKVGKRGDVYR